LPGFASLLAASAALKVASLNLCTDELLLLLADDSQIASVTHLSTQQSETVLWQKARRHRINDGSLLSIASLKPDLVLTMGGGARESGSIARRLGIRVVTLPYPQSLADIEASIARVASEIGKPNRGRQVLQQLTQLRRTAPRTSVDTIWLGGGGRSMASTGLASEWMRLAGLRQRALQGDRVSLEQLLVSPPRVLLRSDYRVGEYSGEQRWMAHPLARRSRAGKTLRTDGRRWTCMGPSLVPEVLRLRHELAR
jgi:iron complex transport system substrate-binding protein